MLYDRHVAVPDAEAFADIRLETPNYSGRMDNLRAAILRVQLKELDENCRRWNVRYSILEQGLRQIPGVRVPERPQHEEYVGSSIQFSLGESNADVMRAFIGECAGRGVEVKWFGADEPAGFHQPFRQLALYRRIVGPARNAACPCVPLRYARAAHIR